MSDQKTGMESSSTPTTAVAGAKRPPEESSAEGNAQQAKKPATAVSATATPAQQLQAQIQAQLQQQLQQQLKAAAERGQQANITPEQIQAQAQAMVQAAAQAQAVVAAAKSRGDGLVPMNAAQIAALSQIQARAIVNARKSQGTLTQQQIDTAIQLQAQALVHAHTQAQIQTGIYKGDGKESESAKTSTATTATVGTTPATSTPATTTAPVTSSTVMAAPSVTTGVAAAQAPPAAASSTTTSSSTTAAVTTAQPQMDAQGAATNTADAVAMANSNSPQFLQQLNDRLNEFWLEAYEKIQKLENQTESDFKTHNDLPLARIKRIMKSDEDVRMISAEAPVLFAKACELFILDLSIRAFEYSQLHKRRTLQKEDVKEAIQKTDIFDFLVDAIQ